MFSYEMPRLSLVSVWIACMCLCPITGVRAGKSLEIYFIDVEGGQSTLVVDPQGESLLIDTGWIGFDGRDADRILAAAKAAGIDHIDSLVLTHYHADHAGGVRELAKRIRIGSFADHGANTENSLLTRTVYADYEKVVGRAKRITLKPGDRLPFQGMNVQVLAAAGEEVRAALSGAGQANPLCSSEPATPDDPSENARSVGMLITYGKFRFIDLGDLTHNKEVALVCPRNLIGTVDLYLMTHHGTVHPGSGDSSGARAIVEALHPRVAILNNGTHKGGHPIAWQIVHDSPGLQDLWQLHYAAEGGAEHNVPDRFIANLHDPEDGHSIQVTAERNATFTVLNSRNHYSKTYTK
jgi:competence protein ComEC